MKTSNMKAVYFLPALAVIAALWACASSGGGISGTSLVAGPIANFGSIVVDEIEFETTGAEVTIEGNLAAVDDLKLGMFVFVRGKVNKDRVTGTAERIASDHVLLGPAEGVNVADATFTSLSQLVITDSATVFDQTSLATMAAGDVIEVFGVIDADVSIRATRVEKLELHEEFELTGTITNLDATAQTFQIGLLTVDYASALVEGAPDEGLADGLLVEVETDEAPVNDLMIATGVEVRDPNLMFEEGDGAVIEGFVSSLVSADEFIVNTTQRVIITPDTRFEGGTRADLVLNAKVDVEGEFDLSGNLLAAEIEFLSP